MIKDPNRLQALVADIRSFVRERWHPLENQIDLEDDIPAAVVQELRDKGYFGWSIPQAYGGLGLSTEELVRCAFELSQASVALRARVGTNTGIGSEALVADGTEAACQAVDDPRVREHGRVNVVIAGVVPETGGESSELPRGGVSSELPSSTTTRMSETEATTEEMKLSAACSSAFLASRSAS